jgi:hypothetical protein
VGTEGSDSKRGAGPDPMAPAESVGIQAIWTRVARWYLYFQANIEIWVNFGGSCNERGWYIFMDIYVQQLCIFYRHLVYVCGN